MSLELLVSAAWLVVAASICVPVGMLCLQAAAFLLARQPGTLAGILPSFTTVSCAVLIPAHNEESGIEHTVGALRNQAWPGVRICVLADNCTDATAARARSAGAEVYERTDAVRRGKGFALDFGLRQLASAPPAVVVIMDADCMLVDGSLETLVSTAVRLDRPTQARYIMRLAEGAAVKQRIAAFAWEVKTFMRSIGSVHLGIPNQLLGTGMAFPWQLIEHMDLATGHITEDTKLGVELTLNGAPPLYLGEATVISEFPSSQAASDVQHQRWERGHLSIIREFVPRLLCQAVRRRRLDLALFGVDLLVPPLAMLSALVALWSVAGLALSIVYSSNLLGIVAVTLPATFAVVVAIAWWRVGRDTVSFRELIQIPLYVARKLPLYVKAILGKSMPGWIRTDRNR
jgi:cellulose synthase/poly-beta-1,6-N-acetylglucosamine synthase-like glycosyltransferase